MKFAILTVILFCAISVFSQRNSETVKDKDIYGSNTEWSCADKHFGYYYISYSKPLQFENSLEKGVKSGVFVAGYTYRYKIIPMFDLGVELSYANRRSSLNKDSLTNFDPGTFYSKINTYHNSVSGGMYFRINIKGSDYRNLGYFADMGGFYSYSFGFGTQYVLNNSSLFQKARFKQPDYLSPFDYGVFVRAGKNNVAITVSYYLGQWISDFSTENLCYSRTPLMLGLQLNLYAK
jgi:hypothetical protein